MGCPYVANRTRKKGRGRASVRRVGHLFGFVPRSHGYTSLARINWHVYFQRVLSARDERTAARLSIIAAGVCLLAAVPALLIGMVGATIDWEAAGWGVPAEDLSVLDLTTQEFSETDVEVYWSRVRDSWPGYDLASVLQLISVGLIFRYLAWMQATSPGLASEWPEYVVVDLRSYSRNLRSAGQMAGLM